MTHLDNLPAILTRQEVAAILGIRDGSVRPNVPRRQALILQESGSNRRFHRADVLAMIPAPLRRALSA